MEKPSIISFNDTCKIHVNTMHHRTKRLTLEHIILYNWICLQIFVHYIGVSGVVEEGCGPCCRETSEDCAYPVHNNVLFPSPFHKVPVVTIGFSMLGILWSVLFFANLPTIHDYIYMCCNYCTLITHVFVLVDVSDESSVRIQAYTTSITTTGFTIVVNSWMDSRVYTVDIAWMACP